jgi:hypothetical protein
MKQFFLRIYQFITEPLYRRLALELTLQLQTISKGHIDYQERLARKLIDELLKISLKLDDLHNNPSKTTNRSPNTNHDDNFDGELDEDQVADLVRQIEDSGGLIEIAAKHQLPVTNVLRWQIKYAGMDGNAIRRANAIETENEELKKIIAQLSIEHQALKSSTNAPGQHSFQGELKC